VKRKRPERRTQEERSTETTNQLIDAAAEVFGERGFAKTSIDDINASTQLTRGALYHHFEDKADLFRAVFERKEAELVERIRREAARARDPWAAFEAGCVAFLEACLEPAIQRIVLADGPSVLGWEVVREIEARTTLALIEQGIRAAIDAGQLDARPVEPLARFLLGALSECAKAIARSAKPAATLRDVKAELGRILEGIGRRS
jgi:AcrR family transcriptional regulator